MIHTFQNLEDFEFNSRFRNSSTLRSLKHVINIIMWIRDMGCYIGTTLNRVPIGYTFVEIVTELEICHIYKAVL
jgi:hypothetical protein